MKKFLRTIAPFVDIGILICLLIFFPVVGVFASLVYGISYRFFVKGSK